MNVSALVLTKNEERDIANCLESLSWINDIHVLDSFSEDKTVEIARRCGARVTQRKFDGYASQANFGLSQIHYIHDWVLIVDADELVTPELRKEIEEVELSSSNCAAFRVRCRYFFMGRWLKHAQVSQWFIRLVRVGRVRYEREINPVVEVSGSVLPLRSYFDHYPFSKGLTHWIARHNSYSTMEAEEICYKNSSAGVSLGQAFLASDPNKRRKHQKKLFYKLPFRPLLKFCYMILVRRAFLDGWAGIRYAILQSIYEYFIVLKQKELQTNRGKEGL